MAEDIILQVDKLVKYFPVKGGLLSSVLGKEKKFVHAVDDISFKIQRGKSLGLVGESGSGKTTTGRLVLRLLDPTSGRIIFDGKDITNMQDKELIPLRRKMQVIFQDPMASLNPYMKIGDAVKDALDIHNIGSPRERRDIVIDMLKKMGLTPPERIYNSYPKDISGGQRQRVVIARALVLNPEFIVADEAVAMLDVSIRSQLIELMIELASEFGLTYLFITHDLAVTKYICDRIAVMYLGKIVEIAPLRTIFTSPLHPYTRSLMSVIPVPDPFRERKAFIPQGEIPNPISPPSGCRFHPRCPYAKEVCRTTEPSLKSVGGNHQVACHFAGEV